LHQLLLHQPQRKRFLPKLWRPVTACAKPKTKHLAADTGQHAGQQLIADFTWPLANAHGFAHTILASGFCRVCGHPEQHVRTWHLGVGLAFAFYKAHDTQDIIKQTIPVELINKTIIAYGPANTTNRFSLPTGVLYLLSDGLYFKSFDSNEEISFIHIEISFTDTAIMKKGFSFFPNWHQIEMNNGMNERFSFTVQNGGEWMLLMKVLRSELVKR